MPTGNEIGGYEGKFTSIRTVEIHGEERVIEGSFMADISGPLGGTISGTATFTGSNERGTLTSLSTAYLNSGDVLSSKGQGVYWSGGKGQWETRAAFILGDQMSVGEGQITLSGGIFSWIGKLVELT